jgi:putative transcriptional regulator
LKAGKMALIVAHFRPLSARRLLILGLGAWLLGLSPVAQAQTSYTGKLLVASEDMPDSRFAETVIYICRHDEDGAFGLVLNQPAGEMTLAKVMESLKLGNPGATKMIEVRQGGPVEVGNVYVLHSDDFSSKGTICRADGAAVSSSPDVLQALAAGHGPKHAIMVLGYAGWEPDQLDDEIAEGGWDVVPADPKILFEVQADEIWRRARERRSLDL